MGGRGGGAVFLQMILCSVGGQEDGMIYPPPPPLLQGAGDQLHGSECFGSSGPGNGGNRAKKIGMHVISDVTRTP